MQCQQGMIKMFRIRSPLLPDIDGLTSDRDLAYDFSFDDGGKGNCQEDLEQNFHGGLSKTQDRLSCPPLAFDRFYTRISSIRKYSS